jgi:hypothetical protein
MMLMGWRAISVSVHSAGGSEGSSVRAIAVAEPLRSEETASALVAAVTVIERPLRVRAKVSAISRTRPAASGTETIERDCGTTLAAGSGAELHAAKASEAMRIAVRSKDRRMEDNCAALASGHRAGALQPQLIH